MITSQLDKVTRTSIIGKFDLFANTCIKSYIEEHSETMMISLRESCLTLFSQTLSNTPILRLVNLFLITISTGRSANIPLSVRSVYWLLLCTLSDESSCIHGNHSPFGELSSTLLFEHDSTSLLISGSFDFKS